MIGIVDIEIGNVRSVSKALEHLGCNVSFVNAPAQLDALSHLILPGVGAYRTAMRQVEKYGLLAPVQAFAATGRPVLGICLGMQLLSSTGEEGGTSQGFGLVQGHVRRMEPRDGLALPHVGWNGVTFVRRHPVLDQIKTGRDYYFVHTYEFVCEGEESCVGRTDYGGSFVSIVRRDNVLGVQFHPEKSQANGLRLLENFCRWDGRC